MNTPAIEIAKLMKVYPAEELQSPVVALNGVDLCIEQGEIFVLLGPNGAGKSTLINIISGLGRKTSGSVKAFGYDVEKEYAMTRRLVGVVPQETNYDPYFTTRTILEQQSGLMGIPPSERWVDEIVDRLKLTAHQYKSTRYLSGGMRRRLLVAKALVHRPKILILDEPTAGVDVTLRKELWDFVLELNHSGTTIVLTTHYLDEAERIAQRVAFIHNGAVKEIGSLKELKAKHKKKNLEEMYFHVLEVANEADEV